MTTSAGEMFEQMPTRFKSAGTISISDAVANYDEAASESLRDTVNDASVTIDGRAYPAGTLFLVAIQAEGPFAATTDDGAGGTLDITYYTRSLEVQKDMAGFDHKLEVRGLHKLTNGNLTPILDASNQPTQTPWPLDGEGQAHSSPTAHPAIRTFKPYREADWSQLFA